MGYAAAPRVAFIVYGIQTFFTAIIMLQNIIAFDCYFNFFLGNNIKV